MGQVAVMLYLAGGGSVRAQESPDAATPPPAPVVPRSRLELSAKALITMSDNIALSLSDQARSDIVQQFVPQVAFRSMGAGYLVDSKLSANLVNYARNPLKNTALPEGGVDFNLRPPEEPISLDGRFDAVTTLADPFGFIGLGITPTNRQTIYRTRLSPYFDHAVGTLQWTLRSDNTWVRTPQPVGIDSNNQGFYTDAYVQRDLVRLESRELPLGWRLDLSRATTTYLRQPDPSIGFESIRLGVPLPLTTETKVEPRIAREWVRFNNQQLSESVLSGVVSWHPVPRSSVDASVEQHFYGKAWDANFSFQQPLWVFSGTFRRSLSAYASRLSTYSTASSVEAMANRILQVTVKDDQDRAQAVRELMARMGLPDSSSPAVEVFSSRAQLQESGNLTVGVRGVRNGLTFDVYQVKTSEVAGVTDPSSSPAFSGASEQFGATLSWNHRLSSTELMEVSIMTVHILGQGLNAGQESRNQTVELSLASRLSGRTGFNSGLRYQTLSTAAMAGTAHEIAAYIGLQHHF
jgi:uncharacterized protein (PEP-CTERM system associated)